jgi:hypothetical protein
VEVVVKVKVLVKGLSEAGVPEVGSKLALMPVGAVPVHVPLNDTLAATPAMYSTVIVEVSVLSRASSKLSGDAITE